MQILRSLEAISESLRHGALTIGNFDGVHLGHARIVQRLVARAAEVGGPAVLFTFDPHPVRLLRPQHAPPPLTWTDRKAELLDELGIDGLVAFPTDAAFLQLGPREFFDRIVRGALAARAVVEGANFFFGRNRQGNVELLQQLCGEAGMVLEVVPPVEIDGQVVSSSRVRASVSEGRMEEVCRLLTRPYRIRGRVIHGAGRGVRLGYPTANLSDVATLLPAEGIYAGRALADGSWWPAAISLGPNPTFDEGGLKVEAHLLDYRGDLYDHWIEVDFLARLRNIIRFASVEELLAEMQRDVAATRAAAEGIRVQGSGFGDPDPRFSGSSGSQALLGNPRPRSSASQVGKQSFQESRSEAEVRNEGTLNPSGRTHVKENSQSSITDTSSPVVDWPRFVALVRSCRRFLLTTHVRPDCDALGSTLAMAAILEQSGNEVSVVTAFDVPPRFQFLDPEKRIRRLGRDVSQANLPPFDLLIVLDTSAWAQLGEMGDVIRATAAKKAVLDHHQSADDLGAEVFRDTGAEAAGRLVYEASERLGATLTPRIATLLFAALATDTGWYRFASTSAATYRLAGRLTEAGAVPHEMYRHLYENDTVGRLQLIGRAMARVQTELGGRLIYTWITLEDFAACGALASDSEDVINLTLSAGGTEAAVILVEQPTGGFKISFRSRCGLDCARLAEQFGGGGHRAAAGAFLPDPLPSARAKVLDAVRAAMQ